MDELDTLIFRTDRIGDFIISCPFIKSYRDNFSKNPITLVSSEYNASFIDQFEFISKTQPLKIKSRLIPKIIDLIKMIILLKKKRYKHIIVLDGKKRSFFISFFLNGKKTVLLQSKGIKIFSKIFNYNAITNSEVQSQAKNFSFLANVLGFTINNKNPNIYKHIKLNNRFSLKKNFLVLHIDEKWFSNLYYSDFTDINPSNVQIETFIKKILNISNNTFNIILTSGNKKIFDLSDHLSDFKKCDDNVFKKKINNQEVIYLHDISFNDLANVVSNSSLVVCCEGAISHLSNNFNVPTLALYEKKKLQHTNFWTGHMKMIELYERKKMNELLLDNNFLNVIKNSINFSQNK